MGGQRGWRALCGCGGVGGGGWGGGWGGVGGPNVVAGFVFRLCCAGERGWGF